MNSAPIPRPVTVNRIAAALTRLEVIFQEDHQEGNLIVRWARHVLTIGHDAKHEILFISAEIDDTLPIDWADRAYRAINEWNHVRSLPKAYLHDPTVDPSDTNNLEPRQTISIGAEFRLPVKSGLTDTQLTGILEWIIDCCIEFTDWLYDEGGLL